MLNAPRILLGGLGIECADPGHDFARWLDKTFPEWGGRAQLLECLPARHSHLLIQGMTWGWLWMPSRIVANAKKLSEGLIGIGSLADGSWLVIDTQGQDDELAVGSIALADFVEAERTGRQLRRRVFNDYEMSYCEWLDFAIKNPSELGRF